MESSSKPIRKRKTPDRYTPDLDTSDLVDDLSVDSNWENDNIYNDTEMAVTPKDDYEQDSFLVSDDDSLEFDTDNNEESEEEYSYSEDSENSDTESNDIIEEVEDTIGNIVNEVTASHTAQNVEELSNKEHTI